MSEVSLDRFRVMPAWLPKLGLHAAVPIFGILGFLFMWHVVAANIDTSLGKFPGPAQVWQQSSALYDEHVEQREKADAFYARQEKRNADKLAKNPDAKIKWRSYTGKPTFLDQIFTSLYTVMFGFALASAIAIPKFSL